MKKFLFLILLLSEQVQATEVYFTPSEHCRNKIIQLIRKAEHSIHIAIYDFTDYRIYEELLYKINLTRIIADGKQAQSKHSMIRLTVGHGIMACTKNKGGLMHNKYMIIDNKYVITGSYNWSKNARKKNDENCIIVEDQQIVKQYQENFKGLYDKYCI